MQQVLGSIGLEGVDLYLRDGPFPSDIGNVILHTPTGTHCLLYLYEFFLPVMVKKL